MNLYSGIVWKSILFCAVAIAIIQIQQYYFNTNNEQDIQDSIKDNVEKDKIPKQITQLDYCKGNHGSVYVYEDVERGIRFIRSDNSIIGGEWVNFQTPLFTTFIIQSAARYVNRLSCTKEHYSCHALQLGLGAGSAATRLQNNGFDVDVVEIDQCVVDAAKKWFSFGSTKRNRVFTQDAADYITNAKETQPEHYYDIVIHDLFTASVYSPELMTEEMFHRIIEKWISSSGVLVVNVVGHYHGKYAQSVYHVYSTLAKVCTSIRVFSDAPLSVTDHKVQNLIFFCSNQLNLSFHQPPETQDSNVEFSPEWIERHFVEWEVTQTVSQGAREFPPFVRGAENPLQKEITEELWQEISKTLLYL